MTGRQYCVTLVSEPLRGKACGCVCRSEGRRGHRMIIGCHVDNQRSRGGRRGHGRSRPSELVGGFGEHFA